MKRAALHNLGCKVNAYETEVMQELLEENGYEIVGFHEKADVYIINTCSVTNMADRKSRQMIHRAKKKNPNAVIVAAGCYVQAQADAGVIDENIDILIGNNKKNDLIRLIDEFTKEQDHTQIQEVIDINHTNEYEKMRLEKTGEHTRAYLKVQDGCNQFCTYCIIPYTRGRIRSRELEDVVSEVTTLAKNGYKEVVLTGIHLSSYGRDRGEGDSLLTLIQAVHAIEGIERIRLGSLEPGIITEEFAKEIAGLHKMCPHFHLSLQSGSNRTLKRMNRKYTAEEYKEKCEILRKYFENPALTTDVIVGFPGETQEDYEESYQFVDQIDFYETHIFKYSKRQGTKAASMPDQIPDHIKTERSNQMIELNEKKKKAYESYWLQKSVEVLWEEILEKDDEKYITGHTKEYVKVVLPYEEHMSINEINKICIVDNSQIVN